MKRIILLSLLFMVHYYGFGQGLIIDDSVFLEPGIYKNFEEFKYNDPSIGFNYEVSSNERGYGMFNASGLVTFYKIQIERREAREIDEVFGFCDGRNVYLNAYSNPFVVDFKPNTEFVKIEYFGKYCYFENILCLNGNCRLEQNLLSIHTGKVITLSTEKLRKIMVNDPELLAEFNKEKKKGTKIKEYIIRYLEKHKMS